ncbi:hypothetical protein [Moritella marina]|uniref:hypothetical protein n=1 Tax=Moritella marina TaxID=90736 RepID=UPI0037042088
MTNKFARKFDLNKLVGDAPLWWQDLLSQLKPAGEALNTYGLRLAVRENYLNFYHNGQAIAKVGFNRDKQLYTEQHIKYVFKGADTQDKTKMSGDELTLVNPTDPTQIAHYLGCETLNQWISETKNYSGEEKEFVDCVVAANNAVIDMEVGLPGSGYRIDLAALEQHGDEICLVFWEAKLTTDGRCRSNSENPKVLEQLARYRDFLTDSDRQAELKKAYVVTCQVLLHVNQLAGKPTDTLIEQIATGKSKLTIDSEPRLLLSYSAKDDKRNIWPRHEEKLRQHNIVMQVMTETSDYLLQQGVVK